MKFGKNKGCNFLNKDCAEQKDGKLISKFNNEFCNSDSFLTCSIGRQSRGYCFLESTQSMADTVSNATFKYDAYSVRCIKIKDSDLWLMN